MLIFNSSCRFMFYGLFAFLDSKTDLPEFAHPAIIFGQCIQLIAQRFGGFVKINQHYGQARRSAAFVYQVHARFSLHLTDINDPIAYREVAFADNSFVRVFVHESAVEKDRWREGLRLLVPLPLARRDINRKPVLAADRAIDCKCNRRCYLWLQFVCIHISVE
jgi:hypothetical protein